MKLSEKSDAPVPAKAKTAEKKSKSNPMGNIVKSLMVFYLSWAMVVPVIRDTNPFGITDYFRSLANTPQQILEFGREQVGMFWPVQDQTTTFKRPNAKYSKEKIDGSKTVNTAETIHKRMDVNEKIAMKLVHDRENVINERVDQEDPPSKQQMPSTTIIDGTSKPNNTTISSYFNLQNLFKRIFAR